MEKDIKDQLKKARHQIILTLTGTEKNITAYKGGNIDYDYIDVICEVIQKASNEDKNCKR